MWASMASRISCRVISRLSLSTPSRPTRPPGIHASAVALAVVMGCWCVTGRAGAECVYHEDYLRWLDSAETPGFAEGVAISGDLACIADGFYGLQVIDITDPQNPCSWAA